MYSQNVYQNQRVRRSSIYIEPVLISREECNAFEDLLFFRSFVCLWRDFCQPACLFAALNYHDLLTFCFNDHHYESFFPSRDSLSCATHSLDLCILFKFIFLYLWIHSASLLRFSHILLTLIFSYVYHHAEYFSYPR